MVRKKKQKTPQKRKTAGKCNEAKKESVAEYSRVPKKYHLIYPLFYFIFVVFLILLQHACFNQALSIFKD